MSETTGETPLTPASPRPVDDQGSVLLGQIFPALLAIGDFGICWYATRLVFYTRYGPGSGFFPMWLGILLVIFSLWIFVTNLRTRELNLQSLLPARMPAAQMAITLAMIGVFALFVELAGFALTMFVVLLVLLPTYRIRFFPTAALVALGGSFGVGVVFTRLLSVYLPPAPFNLLRFLGL